MATILPISIVIPTLNRPKTLSDTLQSYLQADYLPQQIVVVDQSRSMETKDACSHATPPQAIGGSTITYIHLDKPSSTTSRNVGIDACTQEYIIFSDDDINVYSDTLYQVYKHISQPDMAMIAGLNDCSKRNKSLLSYIAGINGIRKRNIGSVSKSCFGSYPTTITRDIPTEWAMGYFFVVKRSLVKKWNIRWDENLTGYAYDEDLDFTFSYATKAMTEGLKCIITNDVHVKHLASKEYRVPSKTHIRAFIINRYYLIHKHKGCFSLLIATYTNLFFILRFRKSREVVSEIVRSMLIYFKNKGKIDNGQIELFL